MIAMKKPPMMETWMKMDLDYTRTWTIRGDLLLLLKTIPAVLSMRGAW